MIRLALLLALLASPALAHRLIIFAYVDRRDVVVEAKFSNDKAAIAGEVRVETEAGEILASVPLGEGGQTRIPTDPRFAGGVVVRVETEGGHSDFWILTPTDIAGGKE